MSHRYRSHCCCGVPEIEGRPADCFLGWGTPPPTPFSPVSSKDRAGDGIAYSKSFYSNAQGKNPHDNWDGCSHALNRELIVSIERYSSLDSRNEGAYTPSELVSPRCGEVSRTGIPVRGFNTYPNEPMYARYRRLRGFDEVLDDFNDSRYNWSAHPGKPMERNYLWSVQKVGPFWNASDRAFGSTNSFAAAYPLMTNPRRDDPFDIFYPHGTATDRHCGGHISSGYAPCDDCICTMVQNNCSFGYNSFGFCNFEHRGMANRPLTKAQAHIIGNNWKTSENGFIPTQGHSIGKSSVAGVGCPTEGNNYPFYNRVKEYGGAYFWLQGISDHTENYKTEDEKKRVYRSFYPDPNYTFDLVQIYRSGNCTEFPYGQWPLQSTLIGVFRREAWWELYWSGFRKTGFEALGINHKIPDDEYFRITPSPDPDVPAYDPTILSQGRLPSFIGFGCSGIPVFSWEIAYLYFDPNDNDSYHANALNGINSAYGYGDSRLFIGDGIDDYPISNSDFAIYEGYVEALLAGSDTTSYTNAISAARNDQDSGSTSRKCRAHRIMFCIAMYLDLPLPVAITDCLEDYGILPQAINHGISADYKIFKKKIAYNKEGDFPTEQEDEVACCIAITDPDGNGLPIGNAGFNAEERAGFSADLSPLCNLFPGFCAPTGCIDPGCNDAVCAGNNADPFCCGQDGGEWDSYCVDYAETLPECTTSTTCINTTPFDCTYKWNGAIIDEGKGITCPNDSKNIYDPDNANFCSNNFEGVCCISTVNGSFGIHLGCGKVDGDSLEEVQEACAKLANSDTYCPPGANCFGDYFPYANCEGNPGFCPYSDEPDIDWDAEACQLLKGLTIEDFYFYGAIGGWTWYCRADLTAKFQINTDIGSRNGSCWNALPFPSETTYYDYNPSANRCYGGSGLLGGTGPDDGGSGGSGGDPCNIGFVCNDENFEFCPCCCDNDCGGWCENPIFVQCNDAWPPDIFGQGDDLFDDDNEDLPYDYNAKTSVIPVTCSNQSATLTCRGIWWQWQKYDYDLNNPSNYARAIYTGCDGINNAFWLVQDPYPQGPRFELGITLDENGITTGMVDNEIGREITLYRGYDNIFGVSGLLSPSIEEQFRGPTYGVTVGCSGDTEITITMRSNGFVLILRGDEPSFDNPDNPIDTQYFYSRSVRFYRDGERNDYIYVFNPFEQLDRLEETKSDDEAWWQLIESYQGVGNCTSPEQIIVNEYRAVPTVYGKVNMEDKPDPEYEQFFCDLPRIKYTGEEARIIEYQWYHPPYVFVRGDPGAAQLDGGGGAFCGAGSYRYLHDWGACCNSVPYLYETAWLKGAQPGPSPVERDEDSDKYLPDPPQEVER